MPGEERLRWLLELDIDDKAIQASITRIVSKLNSLTSQAGAKGGLSLGGAGGFVAQAGQELARLQTQLAKYGATKPQQQSHTARAARELAGGVNQERVSRGSRLGKSEEAVARDLIEAKRKEVIRQLEINEEVRKNVALQKDARRVHLKKLAAHEKEAAAVKVAKELASRRTARLADVAAKEAAIDAQRLANKQAHAIQAGRHLGAQQRDTEVPPANARAAEQQRARNQQFATRKAVLHQAELTASQRAGTAEEQRAIQAKQAAAIQARQNAQLAANRQLAVRASAAQAASAGGALGNLSASQLFRNQELAVRRAVEASSGGIVPSGRAGAAAKGQVLDAVAKSKAARASKAKALGISEDASAQQIVAASKQEVAASRASAAAASRRVAREAAVEAQIAGARQAQVAAEQQYLAQTLGIVQNTRRDDVLGGKLGKLGAEALEDEALLGEKGGELKAQIQTRIASERRAILSDLALLGDKDALGEIAREKVIRRELNRQITARVASQERQLYQERVAAGSQNIGTRFQRLQSAIASRQGKFRDPTEFQQVGQFLSSKALTTAGFAVTGAATFAAFRGITEMAKETVELEKNLALISNQLNAIGQNQSFEGIKSDILEMARDTGVAASQVAEIRLQLQGAFGGGDFEASKQFIDDATESALKINKITGLTAEETTDSLTAIAFSFDKTFEEIGDSALGLRDRFGVLAREIITAAADVAPVAAEAGLSFEETSAIVAAAQRAGGRSGSALSEAIGRILPSIPSKAVEILDEFNEANLEDVRTQLVQQIAQGDTGQVLVEVIKNFQNFNEKQQKSIVEILGERRESPTLLAFLRNAGQPGQVGTLVGELDRIASGEGDVGRLDEAWRDFDKTLSITFARLGEVFRQVGTAILDSGLLDALALIAVTLENIVGLIPRLAGAANFTIPGIGDEGTQLNFGGGAQAGLLALLAQRGAQQAVTSPGKVGAFTNKVPGAVGFAGAGGLQVFAAAAAASFALDFAKSAQAQARAVNESFSERFKAELQGLNFEELQAVDTSEASGITYDIDLPVVGEGVQVATELIRRAAGFDSPRERQGVELRAAIAPLIADRLGGLIQLTDEELQEAFADVDLSALAPEGFKDLDTRAGFNQLSGSDVTEVRQALQELQLRIQEDPSKNTVEALEDLISSEDLSKAAQTAIRNAAEASDDLNDAIDTASSEEATRNLELAKARYEAGQTGAHNYFTLLVGQIEAAEELVAAGVDSAETNQKLAQQIIERSGFLLEQLQTGADVRQTFTGVQGDPKAEIDQKIADLQRQLDTEDILSKEQLDAVTQIPALLQEQFELSLEEIPTAAGRQAVAEEGFEIPPTLLKQIFDAYIDITSLDDHLKELGDGIGSNIQQILWDTWSGVLNDDASIGEAAADAIDLDSVVRRLESRLRTAQERGTGSLEPYFRSQLEIARFIQDLIADDTLLKDTLGFTTEGFAKDPEKYAEEAAKEVEELASAVEEFNKSKLLLAGVLIEDAPLLSAVATRDEASRQVDLARQAVDDAVTAVEHNLARARLNEALADEARAQREAEDLVAQDFVDRANLTIELAGLSGDESALNQITLDESAAIFTNPEVGLEGQADAVRNYLDALVQSVQLRIDATEDDAEKLALAQAGIEIPDAHLIDVNRILLQQTNIQFRETMILLDAALGAEAQGIGNAIVAAVLAGENAALTAEEVIRAEITRLWNLITAIHNGLVQVENAAQAIEDSYAAIDALFPLLEALGDGFGLDLDFDLAPLSVPSTLSPGISPGTSGSTDQEEAEDIARQIEEAKLNLAEALVERDPLAVAQIERQRADVAFQFAENEADRINAEADRIRADRGIREAIYDIANSYVELAIAIADVAGDTVEVAKLQLQLANDAFAQALGEGAGESELNSLRADQERAAGRLRDAQLQEQLEIINFNLEMGKISRGQAIAQLEAIVAQADILGLTEKQVRDLLQQIKQLRDQANADLQFNIPSEIQLPTLYEVRRTAQGGGFSTWTDNRQINVTVSVKTDASPEEIGAVVADAAGLPPRTGVNPPQY